MNHDNVTIGQRQKSTTPPVVQPPIPLAAPTQIHRKMFYYNTYLIFFDSKYFGLT